MRATGQARRMRILLLCSAFNGLTQRVWVELRQAGHEVRCSRRLTPTPSARPSRPWTRTW